MKQTPDKHVTRLPHEILNKLQKERYLKKRLKLLQNVNDPKEAFPLKTILQMQFMDSVTFDVPEGAPPYTPDEGVAGQQLTHISRAIKKLKNCTKKSPLPKFKKESIFIELLESVHAEDAKILIAAKDKVLHEIYPALKEELVREAYPTLLK